MRIILSHRLAIAGLLSTVVPVISWAQLPTLGGSGARKSNSGNRNAGTERGSGVVSSGIAGSTPVAGATSEVLNLSLKDVLDRALKYNLALLESGEDQRLRRAERLITLSELLPELTVRPSVSSQQVNLAAFGFSGFPGVPQIVGPFNVVDARANLSQTVFDLRKRRNLQADRESETVAVFMGTDVRERVAVFVTGLYLQALATGARVESQKAQVETASTVYRQAVDRHEAGTVPRIDVLRAQVQLDEEQGRLIQYEGDLEKRKIDLARAIGLPAQQKIQFTDSMPAEPLPQSFTLNATLEQAYTQRADYRAAQSAVRSAEFTRSAAAAGRYPTVDLDANYGVIGPSFDRMHGTFGVSAGVNIPIFEGGKTKAEVEAADTVLRRRRAAVEDLRGKIEAEVTAAFSDLRTSARQVEVTTRAADLAREQVNESRDRFAAGVTNNLEVVQAQQALAKANENYIGALYSLNIAKASLVLARGDAEQTIREFLKRTTP